MDTSSLVVNSGNSSGIIRKILQLRRSLLARNLSRKTSFTRSKLWTPKLISLFCQRYFFYFNYKNTVRGYLVLDLDQAVNKGCKSTAPQQRTVLLRDFYIEEKADAIILATIALVYLSHYCKQQNYSEIQIDRHSCEHVEMLDNILNRLLPINETTYLYCINFEQITQLASCFDIS